MRIQGLPLTSTECTHVLSEYQAQRKGTRGARRRALTATIERFDRLNAWILRQEISQ